MRKITGESKTARRLAENTQQTPSTGSEFPTTSADGRTSLWSRFGQSVVRAIASAMAAIGATRMRRDEPQAEPGPQATTAPETLHAGTDVPNARHVVLAYRVPAPACDERRLSGSWHMPSSGRGLASILKSTSACLRNTTHGASSPAHSARVAGIALLMLVGSGGGTAAVQAAELVSNIDQGSTATHGYSRARAQRFTTGTSANGYLLTNVKIVSSDGSSKSFSLSVYTVDNSNFPDEEVVALTRPSSFSAGTLTFTAPEHTYLKPNTTYTVRTSAVSTLVVVSRFVSWNPQGSSPVCSVDGLPGMTEQSGKRLESVPSPFS